MELAEEQVGGARLGPVLIGQAREGGVDHKGGGTTVGKNDADWKTWGGRADSRRRGIEESGRSQIEGGGCPCDLEPAPKGQIEGLSLYKWGN